MFIKYQKVRNAVVGTATAVIGGIAAFLGLQGDTTPTPSPEITTNSRSHDQVPNVPAPVPESHAPTSLAPAQPPTADAPSVPPTSQRPNFTPRNDAPAATISDQDRYISAMEIATAKASETGKGKDVLGPASPWKLNLYDDNLDGQWDRGKLDYNRDEVDDEKWTFKEGRWEKDGGNSIWIDGQWVSPSQRASTNQTRPRPAATNVNSYVAAMKIANSRADASGKGKDVLGAGSPWKLNLYDDNSDGQWDRGKLDTNRDDVDDEKWNYKNGQWEKDGGKTVWSNDKWVRRSTSRPSPRPSSSSQRQSLVSDRYQKAMKIATARADSSGKGKDVLGAGSPWKLNLYDDDKDGRWDRGKLDTNRDDVDDEKWNFKDGRWEKDGGETIWDGAQWIQTSREEN